VRLGVNGYCFACGPDNPKGLRLEFRFQGEQYLTEFQVLPEYQGWAGFAHGGLLATVLDEVTARLLWEKKLPALLARLAVRYRSPARVGERLRVQGRITGRRGRLVFSEAEALHEDGTIVASAEVTSVLV
jgi:acyl-coenzyme A thioesterase PaaI-like protein